MTEEQTANAVLSLMNDQMSKIQNPGDRKMFIEMLMMVTHDLMRQTHGDQFLLGWFESAIQGIKNSPPITNLQTGH